MTPEQQERLISAVENLSRCVEILHPEEKDYDTVEFLIQLLNGQIARASIKLKEQEESMPRGRKKKTDVAANPTPAAPVQAAPTAHYTVPQDHTQLITEWKQAADQLKEIKGKENALRQALVSQMFDAMKLEGTEAVDIGWGYKLKAVKEMNYTATDKEGEVQAVIEALSSRGAEELADGLFRYKPEVNVVPYRKVLSMAMEHNDTQFMELLHKAIMVKPGMPRLELVPPTQVQTESTQPPQYVLEQTGEVFTDGSNIKW